MTTKLDPKKIAQILNQSTQDLDEGTISSLQQARAQALQRQAARIHTLQIAGHRWTSHLLPHTIQQWILAAFLVLGIASGASIWVQHNHHQQMIDLDVEILTDELPIEIFLD
jgi:hypothetical protein